MEEICELTAVDVKRRDERIGRRSVHVVVEYDNTGRINSRYGIIVLIWIFVECQHKEVDRKEKNDRAMDIHPPFDNYYCFTYVETSE